MKTLPHILPSLYLVSFIVLLLPADINAQSHKPFHANAVAVYTTAPEDGRTSSLAFTDAVLLDGDSIFHTVKTFDPLDWNGMLEPEWETCEEGFWGTAGMCHPVDVPLWLGAEMRKTESETYEYTTGSGEVLTFDFGIAEGDSALIYQNADMQLYLIAEGESAGNFLGIDQTILQYYLAHLDSEGESLVTALHDAPITLGDQLGAIHFMRIDSFPQILQPITIVGHSGAQAGLYEIKEAAVYDFEIGDIFQHFYHSNFDDPFVTESYYETRIVTERVENESEINYSFNVHRFTADSTVNETFDEEITVSKSAVLASLPFEQQVIEGPGSTYIPNGYIFQNLTLTADSCGSTFTYSTRESFYHSCPAQGMACFGSTRHTAPWKWQEDPSRRIYRQGLGVTYSFDGWSIEAGVSGTETRELIYSSKNGVDCGDQIVLSTENQVAGKQLLRVYPNPALTSVRLDLPGVVLANATLHDMQGRQVLNVALDSTDPVIDLSALPKGLYLLSATSRNGETFVSKLAVE